MLGEHIGPTAPAGIIRGQTVWAGRCLFEEMGSPRDELGVRQFGEF